MRRLMANNYEDIEDYHERQRSAAYQIGYNDTVDHFPWNIDQHIAWHDDWVEAYNQGIKDAQGDLYLDET